MKIGILFLISMFLGSANAAEACTVFAGMSQTWNTCSHIDLVGGDGHACLINTGDEIGTWANGRAWDGARTQYNECGGNIYTRATRVAVQLSAPDPSRNTRSRVRELSEDVVDQVRNRFPNVQDIVLITSTGGPDERLCPVHDGMRNTRNCVMVGGTCYVRSSHQYNSRNWHGMIDYAGTDSQVSVYPSEVSNCSGFVDGKGHLTGRGRRDTALKWVNDVLLTTPSPVDPDPTPDPDPDPDPDPTPDPVPEGCPTPRHDGQTWFNACYRYLGFRKPFTGSQRAEIFSCVEACENGASPVDPDPMPDPDPQGPQNRSEAYQQCKIDVLNGNRPVTSEDRRIIRACIRGYGF